VKVYHGYCMLQVVLRSLIVRPWCLWQSPRGCCVVLHGCLSGEAVYQLANNTEWSAKESSQGR